VNKREHILNGLLLGLGLGFILEPAGDFATLVAVVKVTPPVVLGAMFPDVDTAFGKHRKTLHNLPVVLFFYGYALQFDSLGWVWIGVLSHYFLDIAGSTRGIAWFYPLSAEEFGLPVGVPTSSKYAQWITVFITVAELGVVFAIVVFELPVANIGETTELYRSVSELLGI